MTSPFTHTRSLNCDYQTAGVVGSCPGRHDVTAITGNTMSVNSGFQKLKNCFRKIVSILLRQPRPKPIKFKEYQFQGVKLVTSPGHPRVSGRSWIPASACILVVPAELMWLTLCPPQGPKVILDILWPDILPQ